MASNNTQNNMSTSLNNIKINKEQNNNEELNDKNIKELFLNIKNKTNQENPNMMQQNPNMMQQNPNMMRQNPNMMQQNPNMMQQNPNMMQQNPNTNGNKTDLLNNLDKTFEKEMDNLIGNSSLTDINTSNDSFYSNKSYIKILAIIVIIYVLTNVKLIYLFEKIIPESIYIKIIDIEKYIYSVIFGTVVYFLYKSKYI